MSPVAPRSLVVLTSRFPAPAIGGDRLRIYSIIKRLHESFAVDVIALHAPDADLSGMDELRRHCRRIVTLPTRRARQAVGLARSGVSGAPLQVGLYDDPRIRARISEIVRSERYDAALAHLVRTVRYARVLPAERVVLEMTDAISMNYDRIRRPRTAQEAAYVIERGRLRRFEQRAVATTAATVVVARADADHLVSGGADVTRIHVIGNGTDLVRSPTADEYDADLIVFVGNMRSAQNEDMAVYFADRILPLVRARIPGARFEVVGAHPSPRLLSRHDPPGLVVTGPVPDVSTRLGRACVTVCPMRYGAGVQNKILESLALGVPVVTTAYGLEGIDARPGRDILVGHEPVTFAEHVVRVMTDRHLRAGLSAAGSALVDAEYRWDRPMARYTDLMDTVIRAAAG